MTTIATTGNRPGMGVVDANDAVGCTILLRAQLWLQNREPTPDYHP